MYLRVTKARKRRNAVFAAKLEKRSPAEQLVLCRANVTLKTIEIKADKRQTGTLMRGVAIIRGRHAPIRVDTRRRQASRLKGPLC